MSDLTAMLHATMPLCATLGMRAVAWSAEEVVLELDWSEPICTSNQQLHGGALMALADSAGAVAAFSNLPEGAVGTSTIESKTNFFGAVTDGTVQARARPLHVGGTTIVVETDVMAGDRRITKTIQTQVVLR